MFSQKYFSMSPKQVLGEFGQVPVGSWSCPVQVSVKSRLGPGQVQLCPEQILFKSRVGLVESRAGPGLSPR